MRAYIDFCDVCNRTITEDNKLKSVFKYVANVFHLLIMDYDYFSNTDIKNRLCKRCHNVLNKVILKLRKEGSR